VRCVAASLRGQKAITKLSTYYLLRNAINPSHSGLAVQFAGDTKLAKKCSTPVAKIVSQTKAGGWEYGRARRKG
jgi:hypothetical protein